MEIVLRPIQHLYDEYAMGHCIFWPSANTDAVSCTYNMGGFTPMTAVLRELRLDDGAFRRSGVNSAHFERGIRTMTYGDNRPNLITSLKTQRWDSDSDMPVLILRTVEDAFCRSLCMTHFNFILGKFPVAAFQNCMQAVALAHLFTKLERIVVDVDERHIRQADQLWRTVQDELYALPTEADQAINPTRDYDPQMRLHPVQYTTTLQQSAEAGDVPSMAALGQYYRDGAPVLAFKWLTLAALGGSEIAKAMRAEYAKRATHGELMAGRQLALLWQNRCARRTRDTVLGRVND